MTPSRVSQWHSGNNKANHIQQPCHYTLLLLYVIRKLFGYISGANESGAKISMTVPVSTRVTTSEDKVTEEMGFYVPTEHQAAAPAPMDNTGVKIVTRPEMIAFVRTFGGYAKDIDWTEQRDSLIKELKTRDDADTIDFESYYRSHFPFDV